MESTPKQKLRQKIKADFSSVSRKYLKQATQSINQKLISLLSKQSNITIGIYLATENEVDLTELITELQTNKNIKLAIPKVFDQQIRFFPYNNNLPLIDNKWGIKEPKTKDISQEVHPQIILVPGVAFSKSGKRLGRGGGHFDRYLAVNKTQKVGICFAFQIQSEPNLPTEKHDQNMDLIISD